MNELLVTVRHAAKGSASQLSSDAMIAALRADGAVAPLIDRPELWACGVGPHWATDEGGDVTVRFELGGSLSDAWCAAAVIFQLSCLCGTDAVLLMESDTG